MNRLTRLTRRPAALIAALVALVLLTGAGWYTAAVTGRMIASLSLTQTSATNLAGVNATVSPSVALTLSYTDGTTAGKINTKFCTTDSIAASGADTFDVRDGFTDEFGDAITMHEVAAFAIEAYSTNTNDVLLGGKFPGHWDTMIKDSSTIALRPGYAMILGGSDSGYVVTAGSDTLILRNSAGSSQVKYDLCIAGRSS